VRYTVDTAKLAKGVSKNPFLMAEFFWGNKSLFFKKFAKFQKYTIKKILKTTKEIVVVTISRGFGKSKLVAVLFAIWAGFVDKRQYILLVGGSKDNAEQNLRDIKRLIDQPLFRKVFPFQHKHWRADFVSLELLDYRGEVKRTLVIQAVGATKHIAGLSEGEARPDLIICDDAETPEGAKNPDQVEKLETWLNEVLLPGRSMQDRLTGRSALVIWINTPHAPDCLTTRLMEKKWSTDVDVVKLPALVNTAKLSKLFGIPPDHSIWEEMFPTEKLHKERANYLLRGAGAEFEMQFQMNPEAYDKIKFDPKKFTYISSKKAQEELFGSRIVVILDMAYTIQTYSDNVGISVVSHQPNAVMNVLAGYKKKILQREVYDEMAKLDDKYNLPGVVTFLMYAETKQIELLQGYFHERNIREDRKLKLLSIKEKTNMNKANRIGRLIPYHELGILRFVKDDDGFNPCAAVIAEMMGWHGKVSKKAGVDDAMDSLGWQPDFGTKSVKEKEIKKKKTISVDKDSSVEYFSERQAKKKKRKKRFVSKRSFYRGI
jgi:hypothetical protein